MLPLAWCGWEAEGWVGLPPGLSGPPGLSPSGLSLTT